MFSLVGLVRLYSKITGQIEALDRCNRKNIQIQNFHCLHCSEKRGKLGSVKWVTKVNKGRVDRAN